MIIQEVSKTLTLSTIGDATGYCSTHMSGQVHDIYASINKASGTGDKVTVSTTDGGVNYLVLKNPSTVGATYYPRMAAIGTTENVIGSSAVYVPHSIFQEKFKVVVAGGTTLSGTGSTLVLPTVTVRMRITN